MFQIRFKILIIEHYYLENTKKGVNVEKKQRIALIVQAYNVLNKHFFFFIIELGADFKNKQLNN